MSRTDEYRAALRSRAPEEWEPFLLAESRLPGPRGNLELAHAAADVGDVAQFVDWASRGADQAPVNTPGEFLAFCGVLGIGEAAARGDDRQFDRLRASAGDPRWRVREAVAQGLQRVGDRDLALLREHTGAWAGGSWLEGRAAAAALCEPRLLRDPTHAAWVLDLLDGLTRRVVESDDPSPDRRVLRQALGYCWSVALVAAPEHGRPLFERWAGLDHPDARWIVRENLKKKRLRALADEWAPGIGPAAPSV